MSIGRLYQIFGFACTLSVLYYCWKQCAGLKFRRALPLVFFVTFLFITIHFKSISNPLATYAALGVIAIPALTYGLLYHYELLLIIAAVYIPHNAILPADFGGFQRALNGTNIVLIALLLGLVTGSSKGKTSYLYKSPTTPLVLIFCGLALVSFSRGGLFFGSNYVKSLIFDFKRFVTPMIMFLIFFHTIKDRGTIKIVISVLLIVVVMAFFLGLLEWVDLGFGTYTTWKRRLGALNKQPNSFGAFISYYVCLFLAHFFVNFRNIEGKYLLFPFILGLRILIPTNSRGAWIAFPPALFTVSFFHRKIIFIGVVLFSIIPFLLNPDLVPETVRYRFEDAAKLEEDIQEIYFSPGAGLRFLGDSQSISMRTRYLLLEGGMRMWRDNIFWGFGYGVFPALIHYYTSEPIRGSPHNFWLQVLTEMGVLAAAAIFIIFIYFFFSGLYVYRREKDLFLKASALGFMSCIPAVVVANMTGDRFNHVDLMAIFWMMAACLMKLKVILRREKEEMRLS